MSPLFALNFSPQAARLVADGILAIDRFKCPPWPDMMARAAAYCPVYIHFNLHVGRGDGVVRTSKGEPARWREVGRLLLETATPFVNLHLTPTAGDHPAIPRTSTEHDHQERVTAAMIKDVEAAVRELGADHVIVENDYDDGREQLRCATVPEVIRLVVHETGCGFLLDLSHARLAALSLDMPARDYLQQLPLAQVRELHLTGIDTLGEPWTGRMAANGIPDANIARFAGRLQDHLPFTEADWAFLAWGAGELAAGRWGNPWVAALEYGGEGPIWQAMTDEGVLARQTPRVRALLDGAGRQALPPDTGA